MGRIPVPKKPSSSAQDPFDVETAAAAATKRKHVKPINEPSVLNDPKPAMKPVMNKKVKPPPAYATSVDQARNLSEKDLRKVFDTILQNNAQARATLHEFAVAPRGSTVRPFDYQHDIVLLRQNILETDDEEWFNSHNAEEIQEDVDTVQELMSYGISGMEYDTQKCAAYPEAKIAAIDTMLEMANVIDRTQRLDDVERCRVNHKDVLKADLFQSVQKLFARMWVEHKNPTGNNGFAGLVVKVQKHPELAKTLQIIEQKQAEAERGVKK